MALRPILMVGNPVLQQKAEPVAELDASLQTLIDDMVETMRTAPGVGLAGPQVGVPLRLAVVEVNQQLIVLVNPEIMVREGSYRPTEGCLSVPGFWGLLQRARRVTVRARDRNGRTFEVTAEGLLAQALQHEIDHLDGYLYLDRMPTLDALQRAEPTRKRDADRQARAALAQEQPNAE
jgi:peptide deformylase